MDAKTYIQNVLKTESRDMAPIIERLSKKEYIRLIHASAGICSEIAELADLADKSMRTDRLDRVNLLEECADILWYIGIATDVLGNVDEIAAPISFRPAKITFNDDLCSQLFMTCFRLTMLSGEFADKAIKKLVFYGKPYDPKPLVEILSSIHKEIESSLLEAGFTIEEAREKNIAKLKARYGDKFTEAAALNRDLENERKVLESK